MMPVATSEPRRSLVLAGGGLKVAFQAGVLQVWLDEARNPDGTPLTFAHADGASGGVFNLAMWCQDMSGRQIADAWRRTSPWRGAQLNWRHWLPRFESVLTFDRFRRIVLRDTWGLRWDDIASSARDATFNVWDVRRQRLRVLTPAEMDEDALIAAVSLPFWFPPVRRAGAVWMDAVFATDANIGAAIDRGADEVWVVWTVSRRGRWRHGPIAQYFSAVEAAANSRVDDWRARIERNNRSVAAGGAGEFGRHVALRWLAAEVPLHYLFAWTGAGVEEAVERGVHAARDWCDAQGIDRIRDDGPDGSGSGRLRFRERMAGTMGFGATQPEVGRDVGAALGTRLALELALDIPDLRRFRRDPQHEVLVSGVVDCDALGGRLPVTSGRARLLVDAGDPARKELRYRLHFLDGRGTPLVLTGVKQVVDDPGLDLWADTTTLATWIRREDLEDGHPDRDVGAGVLRLGVGSFVRQLFTFRTERPAAATLMAFASFFIRHLWQVYGAGSGRREGAGFVGR